MTFVVVGDDNVLEQVRKQLEKIVTVVRWTTSARQDYVERDLMLIKVKAADRRASGARSASWSRSSAAGSSTSAPRR
jgi:acetolactate synthase I/III small subunit